MRMDQGRAPLGPVIWRGLAGALGFIAACLYSLSLYPVTHL